MAEQFSWVPFYKEFTARLLDYEWRGNELIELIESAFRVANQQDSSIKASISFDKMSEYNVQADDVDPITILGIINRGLTNEKRIILCKAIKAVFRLRADIPSDFDSIPIFDARRAWVTGSGHLIWDLVRAAIEFADNKNDDTRFKFINAYNKVRDKRTSMLYITFGLFWIRPYDYIALDARNQWLMSVRYSNLQKIDSNKPTAVDYLALCEDIKTKYEFDDEIKNNLEFSYQAYLYSMAYIFQCDPDSYDISSALNDLDKIVYGVNKQYADKILKGVRVYFWLSHADGGIIARGKTVSDVGHYNDENTNRYYINGRTSSDFEFTNNVWVEIKDKREKIISRDVIKKHPDLKDLTILKMAMKTTYPITMEQAKAIDDIFDGKEIPQIAIEEEVEQSKEERHYWLYSPGENASKWQECTTNGIMMLGWGELGDFTQYSSKEEMRLKIKEARQTDSSCKNSAHAAWQFLTEMKPGDIVFAKKGRRIILGKGIVESDYMYDQTRTDEYKSIRKVRWTNVGEWNHPWHDMAMKTLTDLTQYPTYYPMINELFNNEDEEEEDDDIEVKYDSYSKEEFLEDIYMTSEKYDELRRLLEIKKNVILQGAPGVGKTYLARKLAYSIIEEQNKDRVRMIQFHQSYSYEDFIEGYRPKEEGGFKLEKGLFYKLCKDAEIDSDKKYFFIIDEINRGNISKIFGELFMLIENDKRGEKHKLPLLYSKEYFSVPSNVYIIGLMNTADRSLAMIDYALRRRFGFFEIEPALNNAEFAKYVDGLNNPKFTNLIEEVKKLNDDITEDSSLGEGFRIGHSYFCNYESIDDVTIRNIVDYELLPLLKEYWFDETDKVEEWSRRLRGAIGVRS